MRTIEYATINRAELRWPSGAWDGEPDKAQWPDPATGLPCLAVRHPTGGHWCGYVGVAPGHPYHGTAYEALGTVDLDAHGGVNFASDCQPSETEATGICHVPDPGEPEHVWWFGFDCHHCWDFGPYDVAMGNERGYPFGAMQGTEYRTLDYVRAECARLAAQLKEVA